MEDNSVPNQHSHENFRKWLKSLPKVQVSSEFEDNLQRRIRTGKSQSVPYGLWESLTKAPALVYSIAGLCVVAGLSAYIIYRTRVNDLKTPTLVPDNAHQYLRNSTTSSEKKERAPTQLEKSQNNTGTLKNDIKSDNQPNSVSSKINNAVISNGQAPQDNAPSGQGNINPVESQPKQAIPTIQINSKVELPMTRDSTSVVKPASPFKVNPMLERMTSSRAKFGISNLHDSIGHVDSLRLDSLRRSKDIQDSIKHHKY
ncbi:MAG: hypothetical protein ACHQQQ_06440 [Bacteroidota bacterium]